MHAFQRAALLAAALLGTAAAHAASNLLVNPGAETGDISGWTSAGDAHPSVDTGTFDPGINPHSGTYDFYGVNGAAGSLTQNVSLAGVTGTALEVSFWEQGLNQGSPSDHAYVSLTFLDGSGTVLSTVSTSVVDSHLGAWTQYDGSFAIPTGAASVDYTINFIRSAGSDLDAFVDDASLSVVTATTVPEPENAALLAAGLLGLAALRRRAGRR